ncbi:hypothetical protein [Pedobacter sp. SL55]|uniref:hypothetical protein n=1 Tax=Pedobacter sp. SL55 TaxID=2995161 RepID=UPI00226EBAFF|nr:hypothetical protein [Pedobacter sp. SL55]WAC42348.1 hypothetical protein OVA16_08335 [Pedobacter sp. SL55]
MKKIILYIAMFITVMACNRKETSIKVSKTADRFELIAQYPDDKEKQLSVFLQNSFKQDSGFLRQDLAVGKEIKLTNGVVFYIRHNPRKLELEMLKAKNNAVGHQFFDELVKGIKRVLN